MTVQGYYNVCRDTHTRSTCRAASSSTRTGPTLKKVMPVASGGIHAGQMHQLIDLFGDDVVLQFGGGTIGHPHGIQAGATANRVALRRWCRPATRAATSATKGRTDPARWRPGSHPRCAALDTRGDITFNYASTDTRLPTPSPTRLETS